MTKLLRGALIGAGAISVYHLAAWQQIPHVEIVAISDTNVENARCRAVEYGISTERVFARSELMLDQLDLDFVDIATPPEAHAELTELAATHHVHINCQKPFALTLDEAHHMITVCQRAGVLLNINENWRWRAWYRALRQKIRAGRIGRPIYARFFAHSDRYVPENASSRRWFNWKHVVLMEFGVHLVDVLRFLFGEPSHVTARINKVSQALKGEDRAIVLLDFPERFHALLDLSWSSYAPAGYADREKHPIEDCRIEGDRGTIELVRDPIQGDLIRLTTAEGISDQLAYPGRTPAEAYLDSYIAAQGHFINCLRTGETPETAASDNLRTLTAVLASYYSAETKQTVALRNFDQL